MIKCEWCLADGGKFNAQRLCCQVRALAKAPKLQRMGALDRMRITEGKDKANEMMVLVNTEREERNAARTLIAQEAMQAARAIVAAPRAKK